MKDHKKEDELYVNKITPPDDVKKASGKPSGNADKDPFCVYAHERHAVGSKIINQDGSETVCKEDGWQNT